MKALKVAAAVLIVVLVIATCFAWRFSDMIVGPKQPSTLHEQQVLDAGPGWVRLSKDRESLQPGVWAMQWEDGFGRIGRVLSTDDGGVKREFQAVVGQPPVGGWASLRGISRSANPKILLDLPYKTAAFDGPLGTYPAWLVSGTDGTWVIYVHGIGANRAEGLRTLSVLSKRGLPGLLVSYRNDLDAPRSSDGLYHLGLTEWQDVEAAARYALAHGARRLVIASYSLGGQIAMQFMERSPLSAQVAGVILEAPVLDWGATLAHRGRALGVPAPITWLAKTIAGMRARLDWDQLDLVSHPGSGAAPILLFHGVHDRYVPASASAAYARALPGRVTFVPIEEANHVEAWNADPERYAATVNAWCDAHGIGRSPR